MGDGQSRREGDERLELLALAYMLSAPKSEFARDVTTGMFTDSARATVLAIARAWRRESDGPMDAAVLESRLADRGLPTSDAARLAS